MQAATAQEQPADGHEFVHVQLGHRWLLTWVAGMVERYVPFERREAELADLAVLTDQLAGGAAQPPALAPGR